MSEAKSFDIQSMIDRAVADAKSLPDLISKFEEIDPDLASQLKGKALIASKSPWGALASGIIGWLVAHYGLGFDETTTNVIAGLCVLAGSYGMRWITRAPIKGILS